MQFRDDGSADATNIFSLNPHREVNGMRYIESEDGYGLVGSTFILGG